MEKGGGRRKFAAITKCLFTFFFLLAEKGDTLKFIFLSVPVYLCKNANFETSTANAGKFMAGERTKRRVQLSFLNLSLKFFVLIGRKVAGDPEGEPNHGIVTSYVWHPPSHPSLLAFRTILLS